MIENEREQERVRNINFQMKIAINKRKRDREKSLHNSEAIVGNASVIAVHLIELSPSTTAKAMQ